MEAVPLPPKQPTLFGHPVGLYVLFFTEMWERFSYYGMSRAAKALHGQLPSWSCPGKSCEAATTISSVIRTPWSAGISFGICLIPIPIRLPAGCIGNLRLVHRLGISYAAAGRFFGRSLLGPAENGFSRRRPDGGGALPDGLRELVFLRPLLLIIGNGFFKPNISTQVGNLYPPGDPRRDGAYTIFYMGINLGALSVTWFAGP